MQVDNDFASSLFTAIRSSDMTLPESRPSSNLCDDCEDFRKRIWNMSFNKTYPTHQLRHRAEVKACDLCGLLWSACERHSFTKHPVVRFERKDSSLRINGVGPQVLSIFRSPGELRSRRVDGESERR